MSMTLSQAYRSVGAEVIYRNPVTRLYDERGVIEGIDDARRMVSVDYGTSGVHLTHPVNLTLLTEGTEL